MLDNLIGDKYDRKNIKIYEKQKKLSQKEMAKLINTTQNTLSRYETETTDVNFATIEKIAHTCGYKIYFESENNGERFQSNELIKKDI